MKIPKRFRLLGCEYTVTIVPPSEWKDGETVGFMYHQVSEIHLRDGQQQYLEHTFLHELVHAILLRMNRDELSKDEAFVDVFAGLLHQAIASAEEED